MKFTALKNHLDRMVAEYNIPGVDCSVYKEHKEIFRYCTGYADIEEKRLLKEDDLYIIFSMSKAASAPFRFMIFMVFPPDMSKSVLLDYYTISCGFCKRKSQNIVKNFLSDNNGRKRGEPLLLSG